MFFDAKPKSSLPKFCCLTQVPGSFTHGITQVSDPAPGSRLFTVKMVAGDVVSKQVCVVDLLHREMEKAKGKKDLKFSFEFKWPWACASCRSLSKVLQSHRRMDLSK